MRRLLVATALALASAMPGTAAAADPGRWSLTGTSRVPLAYYQGVTETPSGFAFSGHVSLFRTDRELGEQARNLDVIPPDVHLREGYNHIGDLTYDGHEGGRLLLPLECYYPGTPNGGNTCPSTVSLGTGAIGVADPETLAWRYYVRLAETDIRKAMWAQVSPDGESLWTQDGRDLLRYDLDDIHAGAAAVEPVERLAGAVPASGITGAAFLQGRLLVAGQQHDVFQMTSIDLTTGRSRLEIERRIVGESEGVAAVEALGGILHWQVMPYNESGLPTYGVAEGTVLTFAPAPRGRSPRG